MPEGRNVQSPPKNSARMSGRQKAPGAPRRLCYGLVGRCGGVPSAALRMRRGFPRILGAPRGKCVQSLAQNWSGGTVPRGVETGVL